MLIYRIEGSDGLGPYWGSPILEMSTAHSRGDSHPDPMSEDIPMMSDSFCGFPTLDQLKWWFKGWRSMMRRMGFRLKVYEVPHKFVRIGAKQLVFQKKQAKEVADLPIP